MSPSPRCYIEDRSWRTMPHSIVHSIVGLVTVSACGTSVVVDGGTGGTGGTASGTSASAGTGTTTGTSTGGGTGAGVGTACLESCELLSSCLTDPAECSARCSTATVGCEQEQGAFLTCVLEKFDGDSCTSSPYACNGWLSDFLDCRDGDPNTGGCFDQADGVCGCYNSPTDNHSYETYCHEEADNLVCDCIVDGSHIGTCSTDGFVDCESTPGYTNTCCAELIFTSAPP